MRRMFIWAVLAAISAAAAHAEPKPFTVQELVRLDRVSDPHLSPDGRYLAYTVRATDLPNNKGVTDIWILPLAEAAAAPRKLTTSGGSDARWSPDGRSLYFLSGRSGSSQVWRLNLSGGEAQQVTRFPLDVNAWLLSPDGRHLAASMEVFVDCSNLACTKQRLDERAAKKSTGVVYEQLFIRHWDTWAAGTRAQLFVVELGDDGAASAEPKWVSKGIDADIPSKPFGDASEIAFSPDGQTLVFSARVAGKSEPWSTNFDLFRVPVNGGVPENLTAANRAWDTSPVFSPDGQTLYYKAMKRPGFEADRFGIFAKNLGSGATHEIAPKWDRSAEGLTVSADGKKLYVSAADLGQVRLFAVDIGSGAITALSGQGSVSAFDVGQDALIYAMNSLNSPDQLYRTGLQGGASIQLTRHNADRLTDIQFGAIEQFSFRGWRGEKVYGYVVKPWNLVPGKKYPVAFIIHGGPQTSFGNAFSYRWNPQTYAGQGYAVVFIDFHGSLGYGQAFTDSISNDWGGKPLEDLKKGWAYALAHYDFLDGNKAAALGASYGGYMINWIAGNWPTAFKCLVNHDGIFDDRMMAYSTEELWFTEWEHGGTQYDRPQSYERYNPINHVSKWQTPMLVIHSEKDFRVPFEQGVATFTALQRRGIPSQLLTFPNENHWVLKPENSIQWHETVQNWLKRWIGN